jgi:hypothetical protein
VYGASIVPPMSRRRFEHRHEHSLDRRVNSKPEVLRFGAGRRQLTAPAIETRSQNGWKRSLAPRLHGLDIRPRHQFLDTRRRPQIDELGECIGHPRERIDAVQFASFDERSRDCPILRTDVVSREERVFASKNNLAVILPVSGKMSSSTIAGIRFMGGVCVAFRANGARAVSLCTSSWPPAW